ncbi:hypothetical protein EOD12_27680 [Mesorhizobium sp. M7A.T.Ca.TU.009.02.1.1]|nr:hypothetical protein EOD15_31035 [Mesorhizobium sp. M7A.T.Ca.US.000.02.2.1]RUT88136.1 hypothetical protein EOD14_07995 [Mesorhizobium sp. M7A.T.Ca.US.000.02.1.1]RUT97315.1 hypothetical protein EOD12_27680 [Mesorhizobium sp. M7A.T.Ca.TU.009.02.1.1]RUU60423.1 hypothetical protein EOC99_21505 [Mesorhizobium sp. M7A.T.Ca.TU.009.01.1.1]RUU74402.1 hypothetical protein EOD03_26715 [Mesorhizobium sp. M7A.T.Ca.TU.009.01.1.2]
MDATPPEHESSARIDIAVQWLIETPRHQRPTGTIPALRERFGLSTMEAVTSVREFNLRMARAA